MVEERFKETVIKKIVYGTVAFHMGKRAEENSSHKWACYVRGVNNEDLSNFIQQVEFHLHPSFQNPVQVVDSHPFIISENGWGEFEIKMKIYFTDQREKPIEIYHMLKLYHNSPNSNQKKPIVSEQYDELIFTDPFISFYEKLQESKSRKVNYEMLQDQTYAEIIQQFGEFDDSKAYAQIKEAFDYVQKEVENLKSKLQSIDEDIQKIRGEIKAEEQANKNKTNNQPTT